MRITSRRIRRQIDQPTPASGINREAAVAPGEFAGRLINRHHSTAVWIAERLKPGEFAGRLINRHFSAWESEIVPFAPANSPAD